MWTKLLKPADTVWIYNVVTAGATTLANEWSHDHASSACDLTRPVREGAPEWKEHAPSSGVQCKLQPSAKLGTSLHSCQKVVRASRSCNKQQALSDSDAHDSSYQIQDSITA